jgi:hypothetical protein
MAKLYHYVGPDEIRTTSTDRPPGIKINSPHDLANWLRQTGHSPNQDDLIPVTFVVDEHGDLRVADRGCEHVACAGGRPVLSAGEMFFRISAGTPRVEEVSNQSTGYCPEAESWPAVAAVLDRIGLAHPGRFTQEMMFRRCRACGQRNIVKDGWLICSVCGADLPEKWNVEF